MHSPRHKSLVCLGFKDIFTAADLVPDLLAFKPIALEGFEGDVLAVMRQKNLQPENIALVVTDGFSCRGQVEQSTGRKPLHVAELLRLGLEK